MRSPLIAGGERPHSRRARRRHEADRAKARRRADRTARSIVYCACPNEASAVKVAQELQQAGLQAGAAAARRHRRVDRRGARRRARSSAAAAHRGRSPKSSDWPQAADRSPTVAACSLSPTSGGSHEQGSHHIEACAGRARPLLAGRARRATPSICRDRSGSIPRPAIWSTGIEAQAHQVFKNLRAVAQAAGGELDDIVKLTLLLADLADFAKVNEIMADVLQAAVSGARHLPGRGAAEGGAHRDRGHPRADARRRGADGNRPGARPSTRRRALVPAASQSRGAMPRRTSPAPAPMSRRARWPARRAKDAQGAAPGRARTRRPARSGSASRATRISSCTCRCATRTTRGSSPLRALRRATTAQAEGTVVNTDIQYRPRRQLVALHRRRCGDALRQGATAQLILRFFHFYPSTQKALGAGQARARVRRSARRAFRPRDRASAVQGGRARHAAAGSPDAGVSDDRRTRAGNAAQGRPRARSPPIRRCTAETLPDWLIARRHLWKFGDAVRFLHAPPPRLSRSRSARSTSARIRPGRVSSSTSSSRSSSRSRRIARRGRAQAGAGADRHRRADRRAARAHARSS